jgi:hypothetical protein
MKHIWSVALYAQDGKHFRVYPVAVKAATEAEAEGEGLRQVREWCPQNDGWNSHMVQAIQVPDEWLTQEAA